MKIGIFGDRQLDFSVRTGSVRSPVDPDKQLDLKTITEVFIKRNAASGERKSAFILRPARRPRPSNPNLGKPLLIQNATRNFGEAKRVPERPAHAGLIQNAIRNSIEAKALASWKPGGQVCGMALRNDSDWEYICPTCGNRTVHTELGADYGYRAYDAGASYERLRKQVLSINTVDLELIPVGFCAHCEPKAPDPSLRLVIRYPDAPDQDLDIENAECGLSLIMKLSRTSCDLDDDDCSALEYWLRIKRPGL